MALALRRIALLLALGAGLAAGPAAASCPDPPQPRLATAPLAIETASGTHGFEVEVAETDEEKACGLMLRQHLRRDQGMLFDYRPPQPAFMWMANTLIPLDMLFIAADGRIVHIERRAEPMTTTPRGTRQPVAGVLELLAGTVDRLGVREGDRVRHPIFGDAP